MSAVWGRMVDAVFGDSSDFAFGYISVDILDSQGGANISTKNQEVTFPLNPKNLTLTGKVEVSNHD